VKHTRVNNNQSKRLGLIMIHIFMMALQGQWQRLTGGGLFLTEVNIISDVSKCVAEIQPAA
jgi:hypothetical protein